MITFPLTLPFSFSLSLSVLTYTFSLSFSNTLLPPMETETSGLMDRVQVSMMQEQALVLLYEQSASCSSTSDGHSSGHIGQPSSGQSSSAEVTSLRFGRSILLLSILSRFHRRPSGHNFLPPSSFPSPSLFNPVIPSSLVSPLHPLRM